MSMFMSTHCSALNGACIQENRVRMHVNEILYNFVSVNGNYVFRKCRKEMMSAFLIVTNFEMPKLYNWHYIQLSISRIYIICDTISYYNCSK